MIHSKVTELVNGKGQNVNPGLSLPLLVTMPQVISGCLLALQNFNLGK